MTKYILVTMPDNSVWKVPADLVAENRAMYYADQESADIVEEVAKNQQWSEVYTDELESGLEDDRELLDWAAGNMDWIDVEFAATRISDGDVDYQEGWVNGEKEVVEE